MDLPVWQALFTELSDTNFLPIAVAFETRGDDAARPWIEAAKTTYPCLIDRTHTVADLYGMVNVPIAVWIDEEGRIVRPPEPAGTNDAFRTMSRTDYRIPEASLKSLQSTRRSYSDALRDWARNGADSRFVLPEDEVLRRLEPVTDDDALAAAHFRMGVHLWERGVMAGARRYFDEALRLQPESWAARRQAWNLEDPLKSGGPEFWGAVDALGAEKYYAPIRDIS